MSNLIFLLDPSPFLIWEFAYYLFVCVGILPPPRSVGVTMYASTTVNIIRW